MSVIARTQFSILSRRTMAFLPIAPLCIRRMRSSSLVCCAVPKPETTNSTSESQTAQCSRRQICAGVIAVSAMLLLSPFSPRSVCLAEVSQITRSDDEWRASLSTSEYQVLRLAGTERPFSSPLNNEKREGAYVCAGCKHKLYLSEHKYDSGTGWPSFFRACKDGVSLRETVRDKMLLQREVLCARCEGHLGHVFRDGPRPTGLRYCMNGVAMNFIPKEKSGGTA